jgi:hypothetical protein
MQNQFLAAILAAVLLVGLIMPQVAFAQEEESTTEAPTILEIVNIADDAATAAVSDIVKENAELSDAVEATAMEVEADPSVKPEIDEAIGNVTDNVSESGAEPIDVIPALNDSTTTTDVLMTLGGLDNTEILEEAVIETLAGNVLTDPDVVEAINVEVCTFVDSIMLNGTSVEEAAAEFEANVEAAVEAEITAEEVADAEAATTAEEVVTEINNGEIDLETAVETAVTNELEGTTDPTATPDTPTDSFEDRLDAIEDRLDAIEAMLAAQ